MFRLHLTTRLASLALPALFAGWHPTATPHSREPVAAKCDNDANRHRFDFWIGEWKVTTQGGTQVGSSVVQSFADGCGLLENWTALRGETGKSINSYSPALRQWQQFWVGSGGDVTAFTSGEWDGHSMVFRTAPLTTAQGASVVRRLSFTPLADGTVRQFGEQSSDGGGTWTVQYDFYYHRGS
jgi:hypothetical protein